MTLITGMLTSSGVVLAADSAGSVGALARLPVEKIGRLVEDDPSAWCAGSGPATRIQDLRLYFRQYVTQFGQAQPPRSLSQLNDLEVRAGLRQAALQVMGDIQQAWQRQPPGAAMMNPQGENTSMLLTVCGPQGHRLYSVDMANAAVNQATPDSPFMAIGSGAVPAMPFYSFLRRTVYPRNELQENENALLAVCWIQYQVISTTPGGVAEPIHILCLSRDGQADVLTEDQINELKSRISSIEEALQQQALYPVAPRAPAGAPIPAPASEPASAATAPETLPPAQCGMGPG